MTQINTDFFLSALCVSLCLLSVLCVPFVKECNDDNN